MALTGKWKNRVDGVDLNSADDINQVAQAVMDLENSLKNYPETAVPDAVRYTPMDLTDDQKRTARENIDAANEIAVTATGEELVITDAAEQPLRALTIVGKSRQINTPSPDAHATIATVGSVGYTDVSFNDEFFKFPSVDGGLRGIPVEDGGNYTDESGQQWVSDEIRYTNNRVVHTRRIGHVVLDGNSAVSYDDANRCFLIAIDGLSSPSITCLCNAFVGSAKDPTAYDIAVVSGGLMIQGTVFNEDEEQLKEYLTIQATLGTPVEVIYILSEPVEAVLPRDVDYLEYLVLTDEENVVTSGDGAGLSVEYIADTKKYVDQHGGGGSGGITKETDPTVPAWAKASKKPTYTKSEVGLGNVDNVKQYSASNPPPYPVASVNGKTGAVQLGASDVGARPNTWTPSAADVGADASGTADSKVAAHNTSEDAHNDLRVWISTLTSRLNALANSDDTTLDQLSEVVAYIKANRELIESVTTSKVNVADIIDNLTTSVSNKPLSAKMGVELKKLIDAIEIPTTLPASDVYDWAKRSEKPAYTADEVGAASKEQVEQLSEEIADLLPKNQGAENVGKILVVGTDGNLTLTDMPEGGASGDVVGALDESNNILLSGNLADGTYTLKYENADGTVVDIGSLVVSSITDYAIIVTLENCTSSGATSVRANGSATVTITANSGYTLPDSITVSGASYTWDNTNGQIVLRNPTSDVQITVTAVKSATNFAVPNTTNDATVSGFNGDIWTNNARVSGSSGIVAASMVAGYGTPIISNFIEVQNGDVIIVKGLATNRAWGLYDSDKNVKSAVQFSTMTDFFDELITASNPTDTAQGTLKKDNIKFIRVGGSLYNTNNTSDLTAVNDVVVNIKRNGVML